MSELSPETRVVEDVNFRVIEMVKGLSNEDFLTVIRAPGRNSLIRLADADQQQQQQQQQQAPPPPARVRARS
jgi:hypothetical protein